MDTKKLFDLANRQIQGEFDIKDLTGMGATQEEVPLIIKIIDDINEHKREQREQEDKRKQDIKDKGQTIDTALSEIVTKFRDNPNKKNKVQLNEILKDRLHLFTVTNTNDKVQCYMETESTYREVDTAFIRKYVQEKTGIEFTALKKDINDVLEMTSRELKFNPNYVELQNILLNIETRQIIDKQDAKDIKTEYQLYLQNNETEDKQLYKYYTSIQDIQDLDNTLPSIKVLMQILLPKDDPNDTKLFNFYIELLSFCLIRKNPAKILPMYATSKGNTGKSTLGAIIDILFNENVASPNAKEMAKDNFTYVTYDSSVVLYDELTYDSIRKLGEDHIKRITGSKRGIRTRAIGKGEKVSLKHYPLAIMFTNVIPNFDLNSDPLLRRLIILTLPNRFVEHPNENRNEYEAIDNIDYVITQDYEGLSQLLSLAINRLLQFDFTENLMTQLSVQQSSQETVALITKEDPLKGFLNIYVEKGNPNPYKQDWITLDEIIEAYTTWYIEHYQNQPEKTSSIDFKRQLGSMLKSMFKLDKDKDRGSTRNHNKTTYNLRIKTNMEIQEYENNKISVQLEHIDESQYITGTTKTIFEMIQREGSLSRKEIKERLYKIDEQNPNEIEESIKELEDAGLITYTNLNI